MDIWQMRYFIQIYTDRNLSKAARNLFISQQALSKSLKKMEDELQIPLFERMTKGLKPTSYGEIMFEKSQNIVFEYDNMIKTLKDQIQLENCSLLIGISHFLFIEKILSIGYDYSTHRPEISFEIYELNHHSCESYLLDGKADICISLKPDNKMELEFIPFIKCNMIVLINSHNPLSKKSTISMKDLKNESFIMLPENFKLRELIIDYCLVAGFYPNISISSAQLEIIISLVAANHGIAILPECNAEKALNHSNNISVISFQDNIYQIEVGFIVGKHNQNNKITKDFIKYFLQNK